MTNRVLLGVAERKLVRRFVTNSRATRAVVSRFVAGDTIEEAIQAVGRLEANGIAAILDYLGENVTDASQADGAMESYLNSLDRLGKNNPGAHISIKLTQLGLDLSFEDSLARMEKICAKAAEIGTKVAIDMESHEYTSQTIATYKSLRGAHSNLVLCLQAYLKRTAADVEALLPMDPAIRLCKGAYNEPKEIAMGRAETQQAYADIVQKLLPRASYTAIATHDDVLVRETLRVARKHRLPSERFEFQMLFGVRRELQNNLAKKGLGVRVYVPFGEAWYAYIMRRLAERPANLRLFIEAMVRG